MKESQQLKNNLDQQNQVIHNHQRLIQIHFLKKLTSHIVHKLNKNINERLKSLSPANRRAKKKVVRSRNNLKTNLLSNYKYQQKINQHKEEIKLL